MLGRPAPLNLQRLAWLAERTKGKTNNRTMFPTPPPPQKKEKKLAAGYQGPVKIELLKGEGH